MWRSEKNNDKGEGKMRDEDAENFLAWLWSRLKQEPELEKALDEMLCIKRVRMECEVRNKLEENRTIKRRRR